MPSFQHFQNQSGRTPQKPAMANQDLSLSGVMQFAESARKLNFEALCRVQPLVKSYRDKVQATSKAMLEAETALEGEADIPASYTASLSLIREGFTAHLGSLDEWMNALGQKREADADKAMAKVQQSGRQARSPADNLRQLAENCRQPAGRLPAAFC